jgi:hypothetical protein
MFRKALITLAATAAIVAGVSAAAQAKTHINVTLGGFGYGCGYACDPGFGGGYYDDSYGGDCGWQYIKVKKWNKWHTDFIIKHKKVWSCY